MQLLKKNSSFRNLLLFSITLLSINQFFLLALISLSEYAINPSTVLGSSMTILTISKIITLPISGYLVDYLKEKKILLLSSIGFIIFFLCIYFQNFFAGDSSRYIFLYAICSGILLGMVQPSTISIIPKIVESNQKSEANSLFQTSSQLSQFITPTIAALFIAKLSKNNYYMIIIFLSIMCLIFSSKIKINSNSTETNSIIKDQTSPNDYKLIVKNSSIICLLILTAIINFSTSGSLQVTLPIFVNQELNRNTSIYGYLMSIYGLGSFIGSFGSIFFKKKHETLSLLLFFSICFGCIWMVTLQTTNLLVVSSLLLASGIFMGVINVLFMSVLQSITSSNLFGRVTRIQLFFSTILTPLSFSIIGKLTSLYHSATIFLITGLLISIISIFIYFFQKKNSDSY